MTYVQATGGSTKGSQTAIDLSVVMGDQTNCEKCSIIDPGHGDNSRAGCMVRLASVPWILSVNPVEFWTV